MSQRAPSTLLLALLLGCGGERWVIGDRDNAGADAGAAADAGVGTSCASPVPEGIAALSAPPALAPQHLGSWLATLRGGEADSFPSPLIALRLASGAATLRFESGADVPALLDPRAGYLCASSVESCASAAGFVAGFDYRLVEVRSHGSALGFALYPDEPWREWCEQQVPSLIQSPGCEPRYDVEPGYDEARWGESCAVRRAGEWQDIACERLATVERGVCTCSAQGCRARARAQPAHVRLVAPDSLEGALWFSADRAQGLLFQRSE